MRINEGLDVSHEVLEAKHHAQHVVAIKQLLGVCSIVDDNDTQALNNSSLMRDGSSSVTESFGKTNEEASSSSCRSPDELVQSP